MLIVRYAAECFVRALNECFCIAKFRLLLLKLFYLTVLKGERVEFIDLKIKNLQSRFGFFTVINEHFEMLCFCLPSLEAFFYFFGKSVVSRVVIQQIAMLFFYQETLMLVLAVNVDHLFAKRFNIAKRAWLAIDVCF